MLVIYSCSGSSSASLEDNYLFVKKLCKVMATLGTAQLCVLWGNPREPGIERPDNFLNYLQAMLKFLQHPSQNLNLCSAQLWLAFLKHEHISKDEQFQYLLPDVVTEAAAKLMRVGDLSWDTSAVGDYARMDFEETEEFASFFGKLRHTLMAVIRLATLIIPAVVHDLAITQLLHLLMGETKGTELLKNHSDEQPSPFVLAWEQLSCFLDSVIPTLFKSDSQPESAMCQSACRCIEQLLSSFSDNPSVLSHQLSCLHSLCPYIRVFPSLAFQVIKKVCKSLYSSVTIIGGTCSSVYMK
jgi:exportin-5